MDFEGTMSRIAETHLKSQEKEKGARIYKNQYIKCKWGKCSKFMHKWRTLNGDFIEGA